MTARSRNLTIEMARPERFELPTPRFEACDTKTLSRLGASCMAPASGLSPYQFTGL